MNLTPAELAKRLRVSVKTLANWRVTGRGPAFIKVGGFVRYSEFEITRWEEANTFNSTAASAAGERHA